MADNLLDFILGLLRDDSSATEFKANPEGSLRHAGFGDLCARDVNDVRTLVLDNRSVDVKGVQDVHVATPPPPALAPLPGESDLEAAIRQINHITNNYTYTEAHNTVNDASVNQNIWALGDVNQVIDTNAVTASGDGAVAAGDDINGDVNTGDGNVIGDNNTTGNGIVQGDGNAVGDGNVTGNGNDVAVNGSAAGEDNVVNNGDSNLVGDENVQGAFGDGAQVATNGGEIENNQDNSTTTLGVDDHSVDNSIDDSFNGNGSGNADDHSVDNSDNSVAVGFDDHSDNSVDDSGNSIDDHSVDQHGLLNANVPIDAVVDIL